MSERHVGPSDKRSVLVFCSYSHDDTAFLEQLSGHLKALERSGTIRSWDDRAIEPGARWKEKLKVNLEEADIIIFLLSSSFFLSDNCEREWRAAVDRETQGDARIIPFIVRTIDYPGTHFADIEPLPTIDKRPVAVAEWPKKGKTRDAAYSLLAKEIRSLAEKSAFSQKGSAGRESERTSRTGASRIFGLLPKPEQFVGRADLIERIHREFQAPRDRWVVALVGKAGYGKSAVAAMYARRQRADYDLVAWLHAEPDERLAREYSALAERLDLAATGGDAARAGVRNWLATHDRWLLIFDNAGEPATLREYLPERPRGHVVVTSRNPGWNSFAVEAFVDKLEVLDAADYLQAQTGTYDMTAAIDLAELLGCVPLRLVLAARKIETDVITLGAYAARVRNSSGMVR